MEKYVMFEGGKMMGKKQYRMAMAQADLMKVIGFSDTDIRAFLHSLDSVISDVKIDEIDDDFDEKKTA